MAEKRLDTELKRLIDNFETTHSKRMNEILATMDDEEFAVAYFKLMEYVKPKLQRAEVIGDKDNSLNVNIKVVE
jgi:hypothetical protein|tara:strand:+ start:46 stop:267 length:222 start_codon:yes stop_codon:yes gene_type:complete